MASGAQQPVGVTDAYVKAQLESAGSHRALPPVLFVGPKGEGGEVLWRATTYLLRCRPGGFMVILPYHEDVIRHLGSLVDGDDAPIAVSEVGRWEL